MENHMGHALQAVLDTNVVLDALANRAPWNKAAQELLVKAARGDVRLYLSGSTVTDIYYLAQRHIFHDRVKSLAAIRILLESLGVLNVGEPECTLAAYGSMDDFEDAVLAQAAWGAKLDYIVTRNLRDFEGSPVPPISPDEFLALVA